MVRKYVLAAAVAAGGLAIGAAAPASAAPAAAPAGVAKIDLAKADIMTVQRRWRGRGHWHGYRGYRGRGYGYRRGWGGPRFGIYVAPRYYARRCWINRWGYRVCR